MKDFVISLCLGKYFEHSYSTADPYLNGIVDIDSLMANHSKNSGRGREAVCQTKLDIILNECLTAMVSIIVPSWLVFPFTFTTMIHQKGNLSLECQATGDHAQSSHTSWNNIKVFGEVSFSHTITHLENRKLVGSFLGTIVNGRIDRMIGCIHPPSHCGLMEHFKRCLQPLLLVIQPKKPLSIDGTLPELVVYLASLHQSRLRRN
jgi:hypothetical protein